MPGSRRLDHRMPSTTGSWPRRRSQRRQGTRCRDGTNRDSLHRSRHQRTAHSDGQEARHGSHRVLDDGAHELARGSRRAGVVNAVVRGRRHLHRRLRRSNDHRGRAATGECLGQGPRYSPRGPRPQQSRDGRVELDRGLRRRSRKPRRNERGPRRGRRQLSDGDSGRRLQQVRN